MRPILLLSVLLLFSLALLCAAPVSAWAAPTIEGASVERGRDTGWEGSVGYHEWVIVSVSDPEGLADAARVTVTDSQQVAHDVSLRSRSEDGTWVEVWWQHYGQAAPPPPGTYVTQISDEAGEVIDEVSVVTSEVIDDTPTIMSPQANDEVVTGTPTFSWTAPEGVGCFCVGVGEVDGACAIWCPWVRPGEASQPATSPIDYNFDGSATQDLVAGHSYDWHVISHIPDPSPQSDPRAWASIAGIAGGRFTVYSSLQPVLDFESESDLGRSWGSADVSTSLSTEHVTSGAYSMQVTFPPSNAGTAWLFTCLPVQNWSGHNTLMMDFYNPNPMPLPISVQLRDGQCGVDDNGFSWTKVVLQPGENQVPISLQELPRADYTAYLDLSHIYSMFIDCQVTLAEPATIYWDNLRLLNTDPTALLGDFESNGELAKWEPTGCVPGTGAPRTATLCLSADHATSNASSVRIDAPAGAAVPGLQMANLPYPDWSAYNRLCADFYNSNDVPVTVEIQLADSVHGPEWWNYGTSTQRVLPPGPNQVEVDLTDLRLPDGVRWLDLRHMSFLQINLPGCDAPATTLYLDNLHLERVPTPIEGKLLVGGDPAEPWTGDPSYLLEGDSDNSTPVAVSFGDLSPGGDQVVSMEWLDAGGTRILRTPLAGGDSIDLTAVAGLGGYNCGPTFSPDGRRIVFTHGDVPSPAVGCPDAEGFRIWVMDADGRNAHQFSPEELGHCEDANWLPNGQSISFWSATDGCLALNLDGSGLRCSPNGAWRPDGSGAVGDVTCETMLGDQPGIMRGLCLRTADGSPWQGLLWAFLSYDDLTPFAERTGISVWDAAWWQGPHSPAWSPSGESLVFAAGIPFDPNGAAEGWQDEPWLYTVAADDLTRITSTPGLRDHRFSWWAPDALRYPNTQPGTNVSAPVCDVTTTFTKVNSAGYTAVAWVESPPAPPAGYAWTGDAYHITTTAAVQGGAEIAIRYDPALVPDGKVGRLALLHLVGDQWVDVTEEIDPKAGVIRGAYPLPPSSDGTTDLSIFAVALKTK